MRVENKQKTILQTVVFVMLILVLVVVVGGCLGGQQVIVPGESAEKSAEDAGASSTEHSTEVPTEESAISELEGSSSEKQTEESTEVPTEKSTEDYSAELEIWADVIAEADFMAVQYDYDGAIALLEGQEGYSKSVLLQEKTAEYYTGKAACVEFTPDKVSHVFTHSLIVDAQRAFDGDSRTYAYNKDMLTVDEFKKILHSMYDNGYVLVSVHDMGEINAEGMMQPKSIWLPEGKKPVVFSQDDVSYYHVYENDGFADCLFVDENGQVKNKYTDAEGNVHVGDYDMIPILDTFVEEHPDFSYRGRKGIVALTGYNGVFGYRTDDDYRDRINLQEDQQIWLDTHPEYNYEADFAAAKAVADAMKANGWEFASHSWGHISMKAADMGLVHRDTQKWLSRVASIVGETDIFIYAYGADIHSTSPYTVDNEKYQYLKAAGFSYFCNVDGTSLSWNQFGETYLRQGRMNLDGHRLMTAPDKVAPLFDAEEVLDKQRPPQ